MFLTRIRSIRPPFLGSASRWIPALCLVAVGSVAWLLPGNGTSARAHDGIPPSPVRSLSSTSTQVSMTLGWQAATDNRKVTGYVVYANGRPVGIATNTRYTVGRLACARSYRVGVRAFDAAGNRSGTTTIVASTKACTSTPAGRAHTYTHSSTDTHARPDADAKPGARPAPQRHEPPTMPAGLAKQGGSVTTIVVAWQPASDDVGVTGYQVFRNGAFSGFTTGRDDVHGHRPCMRDHLPDRRTGLRRGREPLAARHIDDGHLGLRDAPSPPPPPAADTEDPTAPTTLAAAAGATSVALTWHAATDNVGVTGYRVWQGSLLLGSPTSTNYPVSGLGCGTSYAFHVAAVDAAGNASAQASVTTSTTACPPPPPPPPPPPASGADFYVAPSGSDSNACTQANPCLTLNRAYHVAGSGKVVQIAGGTYGAQDIRPDSTKSATDVILRAAPGQTPSFGHVDVSGGHITFERLDFPSGWTVWDGISDLTFLNTTGSYLYIFGGQNVSVIGGSYGPSVNTYSFISATGPGAPVPANILIDGVRFHDYSRSSTSNHTECLHAVSVQNLTIRNSRVQELRGDGSLPHDQPQQRGAVPKSHDREQLLRPHDVRRLLQRVLRQPRRLRHGAVPLQQPGAGTDLRIGLEHPHELPRRGKSRGAMVVPVQCAGDLLAQRVVRRREPRARRSRSAARRTWDTRGWPTRAGRTRLRATSTCNAGSQVAGSLWPVRRSPPWTSTGRHGRHPRCVGADQP